MAISATDSMPLALTGEWSDWLDDALTWMDTRPGIWTCDDLARDLPAKNPSWPGEAIQVASRSRLISWTGDVRASTRPSRRGSLVRVFVTTGGTH